MFCVCLYTTVNINIIFYSCDNVKLIMGVENSVIASLCPINGSYFEPFMKSIKELYMIQIDNITLFRRLGRGRKNYTRIIKIGKNTPGIRQPF